MGKTPKTKRLRFLLFPPLETWEEFEALRAQGHDVEQYPGTGGEYDLVMGPTCWRMREELRKYLDVAIKAARVQKGTK